MKLRLTRHALGRLEERAITLKEIEEVLAGDFKVFSGESCRILRGPTDSGRFLDIIIDEKLQCVLTVFPTKRKYRRRPDEKK